MNALGFRTRDIEEHEIRSSEGRRRVLPQYEKITHLGHVDRAATKLRNQLWQELRKLVPVKVKSACLMAVRVSQIGRVGRGDVLGETVTGEAHVDHARPRLRLKREVKRLEMLESVDFAPDRLGVEGRHSSSGRPDETGEPVPLCGSV